MYRPNKLRGPLAAAAMLLLFAGGSGCGAAASDNSQCSVGADCPSGACKAGRCVAAPGGGGSAAGGAGGAAGAAGKAGSDAGPGGAGGTTSAGGTTGMGGSAGASCLPNNDGIIERKEMLLRAGLHGTFMIAENAPVDTAGTTKPDGSRSWDLSGKLPGDHPALVSTQSVKGTWYEKDYPGASYASKLSDTQNLLGVFEATNTSLLLLGVVSPNDGTTRTQLKYSPPVTVLAFPLKQGKTWTTTSNVTGLAQGILADYTEKYVYKVDAHGTMSTPFADFPVLRTQVVLTRTVGIYPTVVRTYLFTTECFGTIASIVSKDNEQSAEFTTAAEVQRLSP